MDKITIVVPTYNRYPFMRRLLKYYISCGTRLPLHVLDSSSVAPDSEFERLINLAGAKYTKYDPSISPFTKLFKGLQQVATAYAVFWADDDFLVPAALERCVDFLETNPDYSGAHGQAGVFSTICAGGETTITSVGPYLQTSITGDRADDRLKAWLSGGGTVFYSVQRSEDMVATLEECDEHEFGHHWGELAHGSLLVIRGKTKKLDCLFMMREIHPGRDSVSDGDSDHFDWVSAPDFALKCGRFLSVLSEAMAKQDRISLDEASEVVKKIFWRYLARTLTRKWQTKYASGTQTARAGLRDLAKTIPGARKAWAYFGSAVLGEEMSLPVLLSSRSPHHNDFMPIYQAVTAHSVDAEPTEILR